MLPDSAPYAVSSETSRAAAASIEPGLSELRQLVFDAIAGSPTGLTCDEIEYAVDLSHQTTSARCWDLLRAGFIMDSGEKRATRSGRQAAVYVRAPAGYVYQPKTTAKERLIQLETEVRQLREQNQRLGRRLALAVSRITAILGT